jgi:hypothetical protein
VLLIATINFVLLMDCAAYADIHIHHHDTSIGTEIKIDIN